MISKKNVHQNLQKPKIKLENTQKTQPIRHYATMQSVAGLYRKAKLTALNLFPSTQVLGNTPNIYWLGGKTVVTTMTLLLSWQHNKSHRVYAVYL